MRRHTFIIGVLATLIYLTGYVLVLLKTEPGGWIMIAGFVLYVFGFALSFLIDKISIESRRISRISLAMAFLIIMIVMVSIILKMLHLPGGGQGTMISLILIMIYLLFFSRWLEGRQVKIRRDRQLAAIMFTDIAGFTKLMGRNEGKTLELLQHNRKLHKKLVRKYRGKWLKEIGDGTISIFYTASEAVLCALEITKEMESKYSAGIRIGINTSEIVFTDDDIYGDGVNVASRITDLAQPGETWFSEDVFKNIRNREDLVIEKAGLHSLKNVDYEVMLYKIASPSHLKDDI